VWGIGPETADSIRLYAFRQPELVVDTYARRILAHLGYVKEGIGYEDLKAFCVRELEPSVDVYQEFHALMVEHAKRCYARRPYADPLAT
jgi:endonuclease-3 related protein